MHVICTVACHLHCCISFALLHVICTVACHLHCCMSFALLHVICAVACHLHCCMSFATPRGVLACTLTRLNNVTAKLMQQHAFVELQSRSRARTQVEDLPFCHKAQLYPNERPSTIQVGAVAISAEGGGLQQCYLEKVGDVLVLQTHGLGAAEGGIGCHMDALLLAPLNSPVIAPMAMDFHLHTYCCSLTTLLCCCTMKSALLQRTQAPASLQTAHSVLAALYSSWPTSLFSQTCNSMQHMHIADSSPAEFGQ